YCFIAIALPENRRSLPRKGHRHEELKAVKGGMEGRAPRASIGRKSGFESSLAELRPPVKPRGSACESLLHSSHRYEPIYRAISDQIAARLHTEEVSFDRRESAPMPRSPCLLPLVRAV